MEKVVKSEYYENEVNQEMDINSECVEKVYAFSERSEPVSLVIHSMHTNMQNTSKSENYFFEDVVKSEYDESERKQQISSNDLPESKEDKYSVTERTSKPISSDVDSVQINIKDTTLGEDYFVKKLVKSQYDEIEYKQEAASSAISSTYTEDSVSKPTNELTSLVDSFSSTFQVKTQHPDWSEEYVIKDEVKSEYDETEFKLENSSIDLASEVLPEDKYSLIEATSYPISLIMDSVQINEHNIDTSEKNIFLPIVQSQYDEIDHKQEYSSTDFKFENTQDNYTAADPKNDPIALVDQNHTSNMNNQNADPSADYNNLKVSDAIHRLDKPISREISDITSRRGNLKPLLLTPTEEKLFSCYVCSKAFSRRSNLKKHMFTHTGEKFFSCDVCSKSFSQKAHLKTHLLTHTGEKFFSCDICSKAFSRRDYLKTHLHTHTGEKFFWCDVCSKSFSHKRNLKRHELIHTRKLFFLCDVYNKSFSQKCHLKTHLVIHTGDKCFSCDICSKAFYLKSYLKTHMLTHTGEKLFSCDVCSKAFLRISDLKTHQLTHTREKFFSCDICSKAFSLKGHLKTHLVTHTGDKCLSCDICSKSFSQKTILKTHHLTHTREKNVSCDDCSKSFSLKGNLKTHILTHRRTEDV